MGIQLFADKTTILAGEIVRFTVLPDPPEDVQLQAFSNGGMKMRGMWWIYYKSQGRNYKRLDPSYLAAETRWIARGPDTGSSSNWVDVKVGSPATVDYTLQVLETTGGTTTPAAGLHNYPGGTRVTISARATSGMQVKQFIVDGVDQGKISSYSVTMDRNRTVYVTFEGIPAPAPPTPTTWKLTATVTNSQTGSRIQGANVSMNGISKTTNSEGVAVLTGSDLKGYSVTASASGYQSMSTTVTFTSYISTSYPFLLNPTPTPSDTSGLEGAIGGISGGLVGGLMGIGPSFSSPLGGNITGAVGGISTSMLPGSPPEDVEQVSKELVDTVQKVLDELIRAQYKSSLNIEQAAPQAQAIIAAITAGQLAAEIAGSVIDAIHPFKTLQIRDVVHGIIDTLGLNSVAKYLVQVPIEIGLGTTLTYHYNRIYTPLIPAMPDLITMLVREVITPAEYNYYASLHGESAEWAGRRWEAHWRLPSPGMVQDAFHRGLITKSARDQYMIWHDYKPAPRQGIATSDLAIIAGLQKTLIPRVDIRRGWELGIYSDAQILKKYELLGYEDEAPDMVNIQKNIALASERVAVVRAAGRLFRDGLWSEEKFRGEMTNLKFPTMIQDLWVRRYELENLAKFGAKETPEI